MNRIESIMKPLTWFMALLVVAVAAGCSSGSGSGSAAVSSAKAITAYSLAGATGTINETTKNIAVTLPSGTDVTTLKATFTTTGAGVTVGTAAQVSATTANDFSSPVAYIVTAGDATKATYTVTVTVASASAKAITAYSIAGVAAAVDETAKTIALTLPSGTNVTALVATFTSTGASVKVGTTVQQSAVTANDFSSPVAYIVTAGDATTVAYTVTVTVATTSAKAITAYSITGVAATINETAKAIAVTLPSGTNVTALVGTFTTTGASVKVGTTVQVSATTPNNFSAAVAYIVTAADNSSVSYTVTVITAANPTAPNLGEAGRFVILAPAAITTTGTTAIRNGDIGISPAARSLIAGFTPGVNAGEFTELTNGLSYAADDANPSPYAYPLHYATPVIGAPWTTSGAMLTQANHDLGIADTFLAADPNPSAVTQVCPIELGTLVLTRGVYYTASNVGISTGSLHLDAQGDPNAVFIFNIGGTLTTGASGSIVLDNGAQAKNVFWRTAGITTIAAGTTFFGNVFATTQVNVLAGAQITGSLFAITDRVTLISDAVTKAP